MDWAQDMRKKIDITKEEITIEDPITQEVLVQFIDIGHLLNQQGSFMHLKIQ
jgi:hypothetical protein